MRTRTVLAALALIGVGFFLGQKASRRKEELSPQGRYRAGVAAVYGGRYRQAVTLLTEALRGDPRNARAYYFRGLALRELRSLPAAVEDLTKALALDPTLSGAVYERALARESLGEITAALSDVESLLKAKEKHPELRAARARLLKYLGRKGDAEEELDLLLKERPKSYFPLVSRAELRLDRGSTQSAVDDLDAAIELEPRVAAAFIAKAQALSYMDGTDFYDAVVGAYARAIEIVPGRADLYADRGRYETSKYRMGPALADLTSAIGLEPQIAAFWADRGLAYKNRGYSNGSSSDYELAIADLTKAIELSPKSTVGYFNRSNARELLERFDDAAADARKMLELDAKDASANSMLCGIYRGKKEFNKSLTFCDRAVDLNPYYASARTSRAFTLMKLKRHREAVEEGARATEIDPWWDGSWICRAQVELSAGLSAQAAADAKKGLGVDPNSVNLKQLLKEATTGGKF